MELDPVLYNKLPNEVILQIIEKTDLELLVGNDFMRRYVIQNKLLKKLTDFDIYADYCIKAKELDLINEIVLQTPHPLLLEPKVYHDLVNIPGVSEATKYMFVCGSYMTTPFVLYPQNYTPTGSLNFSRMDNIDPSVLQLLNNLDPDLSRLLARTMR